MKLLNLIFASRKLQVLQSRLHRQLLEVQVLVTTHHGSYHQDQLEIIIIIAKHSFLPIHIHPIANHLIITLNFWLITPPRPFASCHSIALYKQVALVSSPVQGGMYGVRLIIASFCSNTRGSHGSSILENKTLVIDMYREQLHISYKTIIEIIANSQSF